MLKSRTTGSVLYETSILLSESPNSWVYKGFRVDREGVLRQPVVLKILKSKNSDQLWRREFQSLVAVNTDRCVQVLGFERLKGFPTLILEPVNGVNTEDFIAKTNLSGDVICWLIKEVYEGLCELRSHSLYHGDLSPTNIMISEKASVKLIDYGFANGRIGQRVVTTKAYADPLVLSGEEPCLETDLFSLGKVLELWLTALSFDDPDRETLNILKKKLTDPDTKSRQMILDEFFSLVDIDEKNVKEKLKDQVTKILAADSLGRKKTEAILLEVESGVSGRRKLDIFQKIELKSITILLGISIFLSGAEPKKSLSLEQMAQITLRTHKWLQVGSSSGRHWQSPDTFYLPPGRHIIDWKTATKSGRAVLTVQSGEHILLTDKNLEFADSQTGRELDDHIRIVDIGDFSGAD